MSLEFRKETGTRKIDGVSQQESVQGKSQKGEKEKAEDGTEETEFLERGEKTSWCSPGSKETASRRSHVQQGRAQRFRGARRSGVWEEMISQHTPLPGAH